MPYDFDGAKYKVASNHQKEWETQIINSLDFCGNEIVLDLGCGDGVLTTLLAKKLPLGKVVGIDSSAGMIKEAKQSKNKNLNFCLMDINKLDFDEHLDFIFSNAALHCIKNHKRLLDNVYQLLKP